MFSPGGTESRGMSSRSRRGVPSNALIFVVAYLGLGHGAVRRVKRLPFSRSHF